MKQSVLLISMVLAGAAVGQDVSDGDLRRVHVGYYLVGPGRPATEARVGTRAGVTTSGPVAGSRSSVAGPFTTRPIRS